MVKIINIFSETPQDGMKSMLVNNAQIKAVRVLLNPGQKSEDCILDAPVLLFVLNGHGLLQIEEEVFALLEGDVTVVPAGKTRYLKADDSQFQVLAVQNHQANETCGLCALLEECVNLKE